MRQMPQPIFQGDIGLVLALAWPSICLNCANQWHVLYHWPSCIRSCSISARYIQSMWVSGTKTQSRLTQCTSAYRKTLRHRYGKWYGKCCITDKSAGKDVVSIITDPRKKIRIYNLRLYRPHSFKCAKQVLVLVVDVCPHVNLYWACLLLIWHENHSIACQMLLLLTMTKFGGFRQAAPFAGNCACEGACA